MLPRTPEGAGGALRCALSPPAYSSNPRRRRHDAVGWAQPQQVQAHALLTRSSGSREHQAMVMWLMQYLIPQIVTHQIWDRISLTVVRASDWPNRLSNCDFWKENLNIE